MAQILKLPKLVAWAPTTKEPALSLSAILCHPEAQPSPDQYLSLLGDRIQRMVNACQDPKQAVKNLQEDLFQAGLLPDVGHVPTEEAGAYLASSNPGTEERLRAWRVVPKGHPRVEEMKAAREVINGDRDDPEDQLRCWAGLLSRLPPY